MQNTIVSFCHFCLNFKTRKCRLAIYKPFKGNYCSLENSLEKLQQKMPTSKCPLSIKAIFDG